MEEGTIATVDRWGINPLGAIKVVVDWNAVLGLADSIERDIQKGLLNGCLDLILSGGGPPGNWFWSSASKKRTMFTA